MPFPPSSLHFLCDLDCIHHLACKVSREANLFFLKHFMLTHTQLYSWTWTPRYMSLELPRSHLKTYSGWWVLVWAWTAADLHHLLCLSLLSSAGDWGESQEESSWVGIRTGRSLTKCHHRQSRLSLGKANLISCPSQE